MLEPELEPESVSKKMLSKSLISSNRLSREISRALSALAVSAVLKISSRKFELGYHFYKFSKGSSRFF